MENLKPCPFCGSKDLYSGENWVSGDPYVHCKNCEAHIRGDTEEDAKKKWNRRMSTTP